MSETSAPPEPRAWLSPARVIAFAVLTSIPVRMLSERLADPDLWWHLKTGELIVRDRSIPTVDPFSYTAAGQPWVVQEWGAEVILHALREWFGLYGILFYRATVLLVVYLLVARLITRRMGTGLGAWALLGLTAYAGALNWTERPNLLSFVLFVATLTLLDRRDRQIWWFIPLAVVWANLHGMVILGIGLVFVVAGAETLKVALRWEGRDPVWAKRLWLVTGAGVVATFANPEGPGLLIHAFRLIRIATGLVSEWASPDFAEIGSIVFLLLLLVVIVALALSPRRPDPTDVALVAAFAVLALQARRNLAVSAIVLGVVAARYIPEAVRAIPWRPRQREEVSESSSVMLGIAGYLAVVLGLGAVLAFGFPRSGAVEDIVDEDYPVAAIDALNRPGVRVFARDGWAPMVIDRAWPNARVYIDLRWDFYGHELSRSYVRIVSGLPRWQEDLDEHCTTHVLIRPGTALETILHLAPDWDLEREDDVSLTFARVEPAPGCENHPIPR